MSDTFDVTKLKVPELRAELGKRGLNTFGTRQVLVDRLCEAMGTPIPNSPTKDTVIVDADEPPCLTSPVAKKTNMEIPSIDLVHSTTENGDNEADEFDDAHSNADHKRKHSTSPARRRSRSRSRDRDSRRSPRRRSRSPSSKVNMVDEIIGWENSPSVFLDTYNCDLSLLLDEDGFSAKPQTDGGFSMMWAGVRANFGLLSGKAFFEVKNVQNLPVENLDSMSGGATHVMRVGWSTESSDLALGEELNSFGYGGTAKKSTNNKFNDYGCTFGEGDVIGAFLEWTSTEAIIGFSVNGVNQGECFRIRKDSLGDRFTLFPHIYVKNVEFTVNFGQDGQPAWFPPNIHGDDPLSWNLMNNIRIPARSHGRMPPTSKAECEVLMMMGLPGCGKTYYAEQLRKEHPEKLYNVLGTNLILDKMKVIGLARQRNYHGRWEVLIEKATKCLNVLITCASKRRRNYILDQTNVYPTAQRRKMRPFEGFKRKAIVIVPTDEEFRRRIAQREKEEGKEVPESAVLEMKANFGIPSPVSEDPNSLFEEVIFTELNSSEARELVEKYNEEGRASRAPPEKRQRWEGSRDRESDRESRDSRYRGGGYDRDGGREFGNRGRRDDSRGYDRRDDRSHFEYRGGYNAQRDRSREDDRYGGRNRERDYGRSPGDRFGGPGSSGGRYGGPPPARGGGFPPPPGTGYGGPRGSGGMMMRGGRGGPPMAGSRGGGYGDNSGPGYSSSNDFRGRPPPRTDRGSGYRGGRPDAVGSYGPSGSIDSMYGAPPPGRFDRSNASDQYSGAPASSTERPPPSDGGPVSGGYSSGGYGGPPDSSDTRGRGSSRGGPISRGRGGYPPGGRGGYPDRDSSYGEPRAQSYNSGYSRSGASSYGQPPSGPPPSSVPYGGGSTDYSSSGRDRYPGGGSDSYGSSADQSSKPPTTYPPPSTPGYPGGYQSGPPPGYPSASQTGYPPSSTGYPPSNTGYPPSNTGYPPSNTGYPSSSTGYPPSSSSYPPGAPEGYPGAIDNRSTAAGGTRPPARCDGSRFGPSGSDKAPMPSDSQSTNIDNASSGTGGSLYASGAAHYGESRSGAPSQPPPSSRQSRFDNKPTQPSAQHPNQPSSTYSAYSSGGSYQSGYPYGGSGTMDQSNQPVPPGMSSGQRPGANPGQTNKPTNQTQPPQTAYGYGYATKPDVSAPQVASAQPAYATTDYSNYAGYNSSYGTASKPPAPTGGTTNQTQSLYASAVSGKPAVTQAPSTAPTQAQSGVSNPALAAYASYYGYGSAASTTNPSSTTQPPPPPPPTGTIGAKYASSMAASQQYNTWQQPPTTQSTSSGAVTTTASSTATQPSAAAVAAAYSNYYSGYQQQMYAAAGYGAPSSTGTTGTTASGITPASGQTMPPYGGYPGYR